MPNYTLKIIRDTVFKQQPIPSDKISDPTQKQSVPSGKSFIIHSYKYDEGSRHYKISLLNDLLQGKNTWWVFGDHAQIIKDGAGLMASKPKEVKLAVPWFSQLDNQNTPYGSCNVTSVAMCLYYFGLRAKRPGKQLEDELYEYCDQHGLDRHVPADLAKVIQAYGYVDDFQPHAKWDDVKAWLDKGNPAIVHGYFTASGHITVIRGYNDRGWIVNDPYGEWFDGGYDTNASGNGLVYSYAMMQRVCGADGDLWIHYVSRPKLA